MATSDVIVVGAGVIGCSIAHELARRGVSVQIIDERHAGMGSTHAAAGMLAPYIEAQEGGPHLDLSVRSLHLYDEFVSRASEDSGVAIHYRRSGSFHVATGEERLSKLRELHNLLIGRGVGAELATGATVRDEEPHLAGDVLGGLLIPVHGFVSVDDLVHALAGAARRHGAQVVETSHVLRIARNGTDADVETARGTLTAGAVVLAAGAWSGQIEIEGVGRPVPVKPIRGQLLRFAWHGPTLRRITWSERCYLVPWDDGTLLVGATAEDAGFDERVTVAAVHDLVEAACEVVPHAWTAAFLGSRVGLRPASADHLPVIGTSRVLPNLTYATGHFRNGILLAPLTAQLVGDLLLDGRHDPVLADVGPQRFGDL